MRRVSARRDESVELYERAEVGDRVDYPLTTVLIVFICWSSTGGRFVKPCIFAVAVIDTGAREHCAP